MSHRLSHRVSRGLGPAAAESEFGVLPLVPPLSWPCAWVGQAKLAGVSMGAVGRYLIYQGVFQNALYEMDSKQSGGEWTPESSPESARLYAECCDG